jgi:hypothetical protein
MTGDGWTYLIQAEGGGPVKIGSTGGDPMARLAQLQTGHPEELRIVGLYTGRGQERRLHGLLEHARIRGEWFDTNDRDVDVIVRICKIELGRGLESAFVEHG